MQILGYGLALLEIFSFYVISDGYIGAIQMTIEYCPPPLIDG